ncbi:hypothetical protein STCU_02424 [Strigomonas culicis]|uniref:Uncharacterized protein n=1 Tax=Strigomonas culicis TaxID=28005 RepID=S9WB59_9TRYP|nr:hypothetical protein STCU_02424 [Strigomonas culicis]|eukprot:EPY33205.1 hypothetical protein STCU_02424 [Strigomonas culicis]
MGLPIPTADTSSIPPPTPYAPQGGPLSVADMTAAGMAPPPPQPQDHTALPPMGLPSSFLTVSSLPLPGAGAAAAPSPTHGASLLAHMGLHAPGGAAGDAAAPAYPYSYQASQPAPAQPTPPADTASHLAVPPTMSLEKWLELEAAALRRVPNAEQTRYLDVDEVMRDAVCQLFVQSDYDVLRLLTNVTRSLQHIGRHDVGLMRNESFTAFTVTQSEAYGGRGADVTLSEVERRRRAVAESIDRIHRSNLVSKETFDRIAAQAAVEQNRAPPPVLTATATQPARNDPFRKSAYEEMLDHIARERAAKTRDGRKKRSTSAHQRRAAAQSLPATYNGNYLLNRYGGAFPEENYYSNYRYNGLKK